MSLDNLLTIQRWFHRAYTLRDPGALELIDEAAVTDGMGERMVGREAWRRGWMKVLEAYPELHIGVEDAAVEGDWVAVRCRAVGRHRNGARVDFGGGGYFRYQQGRCVEGWNAWDFHGALVQSGHVDPTALERCLGAGGAAAPTRGEGGLYDPNASPVTTTRVWFDQLYARRNLRAVEELAADDLESHGLPVVMRGKEQFVQGFYQPVLRAFGELRVELEQPLVQGERVAFRGTARGVHHATGREVSFSGLAFARVREGLMRAGWNAWDFLGLLRQTGLLVGDPLAEAGLA